MKTLTFYLVLAPRLCRLAMLLFVGSISVAAPLFAQSACDEVLGIAEREYQEGFFNEASSRLYSCLERKAFGAEQEKAAYLLLGKIHYANLEMEKAKDTVRTLLMQDPTLQLNPQDYKPGFVDLVQEVMSEIQVLKRPTTMRSGFWLSFGIGPAGANIECTCPLPDDDVWRGGGGGSLFLALGGTVSPQLQLGAEMNVWARADDDANRTSNVGLVSFVARYYPSASGNFFLKGGVGFGSSRLEANPEGNLTFNLESSGMGMQFGLGYDILVGQARKFAISPSLTLSAVFAGEEGLVVDGNRLGAGGNPSFLQLGFGVTWL